jgi:type I restriction enzyme S subunit
MQLRRLFRVVNGGTPTADLINWDGEVRWATPVDLARVDGEFIDETERRLTVTGLRSGSRSVPSDSLILSTRAPIGYVAQTVREIAFNQGCRGLVPVVSMDIRYFRYQLSALRADLQSLGAGSTFQELSTEALATMRLTKPGVETQSAIANFLDAETAHIDALIAKKRLMLRLLKERRRSYLLSLFNPSGSHVRSLEWLGKVPRDWPLVQIGVVGDFYAGTTFPHSYQGQTVGDYPFIKVGDLWSDEAGTAIDTATNWITRFDAQLLGGRVVPAGSVLYARVGEALRINPRRLTRRPSLVDDNVRAIRFRYGDGRYWSELLTLLDLAQLANPGPVPSVSEGQVATVRVPLAPIQEQVRISDAMARERAVRSKVSVSITEQIERLAEHRQALITAAVTGQLKVPGDAA